jgi:signal transduction histidine kinase
MTDRRGTKAELIAELGRLRQRVAQLEVLARDAQLVEDQATWLTSFPEQNPNPVIEADAAGRITYLNPAAQAQFPELWAEGFSHTILQDLDALVAAFQTGDHPYVAREIDVGNAVYEQKICYTRDHDKIRVRVYVHDITRRKRAEEAIQELAKRVVFAQEEERQRVSRELHDEAGQALTALKLSLELIRGTLPPADGAVCRKLDEAIALTEATKERIRLLARGLRPPALDTVGLNLTLEAFCRDLANRTQSAIRYQGTEIPGLSDASRICLYRVLQEALTNVVKHAQATRVEVRLLALAGTARLIVADNGRGFDRNPGALLHDRPTGIGLLGMQERLELCGGWLKVESAPGRGTRVVASVPLAAAP